METLVLENQYKIVVPIFGANIGTGLGCNQQCYSSTENS